MDNNSRSASPREPSRPQQRPPSPPANGFENRAYQHDDTDDLNHNNHQPNDSYGAPNGKHEPNGDTKTLEAVNLELINLAPKNGNAQKSISKKEVEVDMNATSPYEEYFVPVNEHKKYMR